MEPKPRTARGDKPGGPPVGAPGFCCLGLSGSIKVLEGFDTKKIPEGTVL